jgi:hypothetical protein
LRNWYAGGVSGEPIDDLLIYELAFQCGQNPAEIRETWDFDDINTMGAILWAKQQAGIAMATRSKTPLSSVPSWHFSRAPFKVIDSKEDDPCE